MKILFKNLWKISIVRNIYLLLVYYLSLLLYSLGKYYTCARLFCFHYRLLYPYNGAGNITNFVFKKYDTFFFNRIIANCLDENLIYRSFIRTRYFNIFRSEFDSFTIHDRVTLRYPKDDDLERLGDLMVLKKYNHQNNEKGVLLLHYNESFKKFASLYNLKCIAERYILVLEPSWWGYQNSDILFFLGLDTPIIIECPYSMDYKFIKRIGNNFYPIRIGAGDWVDHNCFTSGRNCNKTYDIVYIGNWSKLKRHSVLFCAVKQIDPRPKVALIGYPHHGRTKKDILDEAKFYGVDDCLTIYENITPEKVSEILMSSKINVLLSEGEGANRGIYEGLFCGNILVVYKYNKGVNSQIINSKTGFFSSDDELPIILADAIANYYKYDTARWAVNNTGYIKSSYTLNEFLRNLSLELSLEWTRDIVKKMNKPNNRYVSNEDRREMFKEYLVLEQCMRH